MLPGMTKGPIKKFSRLRGLASLLKLYICSRRLFFAKFLIFPIETDRRQRVFQVPTNSMQEKMELNRQNIRSENHQVLQGRSESKFNRHI